MKCSADCYQLGPAASADSDPVTVTGLTGVKALAVHEFTRRGVVLGRWSRW